MFLGKFCSCSQLLIAFDGASPGTELVLGYEWSLQLKKGWGDTQKELQIGVNWRGEVTDVNLYGSAFDEEQMKRWTTSCESPTPGDILAWQPELRLKRQETFLSQN